MPIKNHPDLPKRVQFSTFKTIDAHSDRRMFAPVLNSRRHRIAVIHMYRFNCCVMILHCSLVPMVHAQHLFRTSGVVVIVLIVSCSSRYSYSKQPFLRMSGSNDKITIAPCCNPGCTLGGHVSRTQTLYFEQSRCLYSRKMDIPPAYLALYMQE